MNGRPEKDKRVRGKNSNPLIFQPRDLEIITKVDEFGFLSREQIQKLHFRCVTRANIRLKKLFDHGYLCRRFVPIGFGSMAIYFLGPEGIRLISESNGADSFTIQKRQQSFDQKKDMFLRHDLAVNDVRIAFYQAMANPNGLRLDRWFTPIDCLEDYSLFDPKLGKEIKIVFRPDGYFRYFHHGKLFGCFLELDQSTMTTTRFQTKVRTYLEYAQSILYQRRHSLKFFRVLVVAKTRERCLNLKVATEKLTDKMFWFTTLEELDAETVFGPIWQRPGKEGKFSLLES